MMRRLLGFAAFFATALIIGSIDALPLAALVALAVLAVGVLVAFILKGRTA